MREGKTRRDHLSGAWTRHLRNQELRREWNQEYMRLAKAGSMKTLPYPVIGHVESDVKVTLTRQGR